MSKSWTFKPNKTALIKSKKAAARGIAIACEFVLGEAQAIVPIEETTLERSGTVSVDEGKLIGAVSFDTPYAVKQHEDLTLHHDAGREGKYLEKAFTKNTKQVNKILADTIRGEL